MTGILLLDWAILAVSLFNTTLLLWLGLTVLLNADRRNPGVWLMGGGLLMGAAFFISHTAILGQSLTASTGGLNFWWRIGWLPVTIAPFAWYIVVLWYSGFWEKPRSPKKSLSPLFRRHIVWLGLTSVTGLILVGLMLSGRGIPSYESIIHLDLSGTLTIRGVPVLLLVIPSFMTLCILLSLDVLLRPAPSRKPSVEIGRLRSRPWLLATAVSLLAVSLLVVYFIVRVVQQARQGTVLDVRADTIGLFDLVIAGLISAATLLAGQAVVAYEIFTGRALPRRSLTRHWRRIIILSAGYAVVIGWSIAVQLRPVYSLLLTTLLMVSFYALYSWRTFVERDQFMRNLRPFVGSQRLVTHLLNPSDDQLSRANELFQATCRQVLGTQEAQLIPLGPLAPMVGGALVYPAGNRVSPLQPPPTLLAEPVALNPDEYDGCRWAIPLWAERGLIGALLIAGKTDDGLYTQEEFDAAQASGERILDMLAGEQMVRRLMQLQRKRLAENRVTDLRTRRALHDDVLPALHSAILQLGGSQSAPQETVNALMAVHRQISGLIRLPGGAAASHADDLPGVLRGIVEREFSQLFDGVRWEIGDTPIPALDPLVKEVVQGAAREIARNAALHGRSPERPLHLTVTIENRDALSIRIADDGVGIGHANGHESGTPVGSGGGLELHRTLLAVVGGDCVVEPRPGGGTQATILLPRHILEVSPAS